MRVHRSKDGPYFLHVLRFLETIKNNDKDRNDLARWTNDLGGMIQKRLDEAVDNPAHYEKVFWFADYFNDVFGGVADVKLIEAPGLKGGAKWG
jgi:hypothetical protein